LPQDGAKFVVRTRRPGRPNPARRIVAVSPQGPNSCSGAAWGEEAGE